METAGGRVAQYDSEGGKTLAHLRDRRLVHSQDGEG